MITSWTSEGMDWNDPNPLQAKYWEAIRLAITERNALVTGSTFYSYFGDWRDYGLLRFPLYDSATFDVACNNNFIQKLYEAIYYKLAPLFLNQIVSSGDWSGIVPSNGQSGYITGPIFRADQWSTGDNITDGAENWAPNWEKRTLLLQLGQSDYSGGYFPSDYRLQDIPIENASNKDVLKQLYALLNLLKWVKWTGAEVDLDSIQHRNINGNDTYANLYPLFNAQPWQAGAGPSHFSTTNYVIWTEVGNPLDTNHKRLHAYRRKYNLKPGQASAIAVNYSVDFYYGLSAGNAYPGNTPLSERTKAINKFGLGITDNDGAVLIGGHTGPDLGRHGYIKQSFNNVPANTYVLSDYMTNGVSHVQLDGTETGFSFVGLTRGTNYVGRNTLVLVFKYDVPDGLKFQA